MPKDTDSTIKFKADITDLKASMQEAGRYIRLANSEFKAATAGMDDWSRSADGLSAKTRQLNTILQAQKQQLSALETDYRKVVAEQGENSKGAEELKIKINNQKAAIAQTETQLDKYENELKDVSKETKNAGDEAEKAANGGFTILKGAMANLVSQGITAVLGGLRDLGGALIDVGKQAIANYAEFEQLQGGIQKLFGAGGMSAEEYAASVGKSVDEIQDEYNNLMTAQSDVMENAANAYQTAGMSANDYMNTVTSFSASLISGLGGDTVEAARLADVAITDMADNANTFGTSITDIQNAYQGFAKGNFTMLDNLKLGYGGTQSEMIRLINDSGILEEQIDSLDNVSFDQMIEAIHAVQDNMGIAGTTAREASQTIEGSVNAAKAAWQNLLTGIADDNADFDGLMNNFIDSLMTALGNLIPRIKTVIKGVTKLITQLIQQLLPVVIDLINTELPTILEAGGQLLMTLIEGILEALPQLTTTVMTIITQLITGLSTALPRIVLLIVQMVPQIINALIAQVPALLQAGITLLMAIVQAVPTVITQMHAALPGIITTVLDALIQAIPVILDGATEMLNSIVESIPIIIESLTTTLPDIIDTILNALIDAFPLILDGAITLLNALIEAIPTIVNALKENFPNIINRILTSLVEALPSVLDGAITLLMAIVDAIPTIIIALANALPDIISTITTTLTDNFDLILEAAILLLMALIEAIPEIVVSLGENLPEIITAIVDGLGEGFVDIFDAGVDLIEGLWEGIQSAKDWLMDKVGGFAGDVVDGVCDFFGIGSPSKVFRDKIGKWLPPGITVGFEEAMPAAIKNMTSSARGLAQDIADEMAVPLDDISISAGQARNIQSLNGGSGSYGAADGSGSSGGGQTINFYQTNNSPEPLNRLTVFRETNSLLFSAGVQLNNV